LSITFLTLDEVLALHADQIERYGGRPGVRDVALLQAALAVPAATFGGVFLHGTVDEMAAAYLFHMARNHPFVDGNKRTALMAMLAFLGLNGFRLVAPANEVFDVVAGIAGGRTSKAEAAVFIQKHRARRRGILPGEDRP
jgi:death-on-curing protein